MLSIACRVHRTKKVVPLPQKGWEEAFYEHWPQSGQGGQRQVPAEMLNGIYLVVSVGHLMTPPSIIQSWLKPRPQPVSKHAILQADIFQEKYALQFSMVLRRRGVQNAMTVA